MIVLDDQPQPPTLISTANDADDDDEFTSVATLEFIYSHVAT